MAKPKSTTKLKLYVHTIRTFLYYRKYSTYYPREYKILSAISNALNLSFRVLVITILIIVFIGLYFALALLIAALMVYTIGTFSNIVVTEDISALIAIISFASSTLISLHILYKVKGR